MMFTECKDDHNIWGVIPIVQLSTKGSLESNFNENEESAIYSTLH